MMTAGRVLKEERLKKRKSLAQISARTKIKKEFLLALEKSVWEELPDFAITRGFASSYAQVVGADTERVVALVRRDFPNKEPVLRNFNLPLVPKAFWTPKTTVFVSLVVLILVLGLWLTRQYILFASPPKLEIVKLEQVEGGVLVRGKTYPQATVEINGQLVLVNKDGTFVAKIEGVGKGDLLEAKAVSRTGRQRVVKKPLDFERN